MNQLIPTEAQEQTALFQWAQLQSGKYPELALMFAIPNGGSRNIIEAKNLKAQGVKRGVPDIFLPVARGGYHGLFIELKRTRGGRTSLEQAQTHAEFRRQGYGVCVCYGWEVAAGVIMHHLQTA